MSSPPYHIKRLSGFSSALTTPFPFVDCVLTRLPLSRSSFDATSAPTSKFPIGLTNTTIRDTIDLDCSYDALDPTNPIPTSTSTRRLRIFYVPHILPRLLDMRRDVQEIFRVTPHHKQVMMFSATLSKEIRVTCKKFMNNARTLSSRSIDMRADFRLPAA